MIEAVPAGYQIQFPEKKEVPTDRVSLNENIEGPSDAQARASLSENTESPADAQARASLSENAGSPADAPAGAHDASTDV